MRRSSSYLANGELAKLSRAYSTWAAFAADSAFFVQKLRKGLQFVINGGMSRTFSTWVEMASIRGECLQALHRGVSFMTNRSLALGFAGWRHGIAFFVDHQCARVALEPRATSAFLRLMTSRAWRSWLALIRIQVIVRSGISHALNLTLRHSFATWMAASSPELHAALLFLTGTALSKGWRKWVRALVTRRTTLLEPKFRALLTRSKLMISKASEYRKRRQVALANCGAAFRTAS